MKNKKRHRISKKGIDFLLLKLDHFVTDPLLYRVGEALRGQEVWAYETDRKTFLPDSHTP
jgi:hypothetical protein